MLVLFAKDTNIDFYFFNLMILVKALNIVFVE
jgi:hypothetical protein